MFAQIDPSNVSEFASAIISAAGSKNYALLSAMGVVALVYLARKFGSKFIPWLSSDRAGALLSLLGGFGAAAVGAAQMPGVHTVGSVLGDALLASATASGTYVLLKKLLFPSGAEKAQEIVAAEAKVEAKAAEAITNGDKTASEILEGLSK